MSWKSFARELERSARRANRANLQAARRQERAQTREARELAKLSREQAKADERARAQSEVATYDNYLSILVSVHKDASSPVPWQTIASEGRPADPKRTNANEASARLKLEGYTPGFFDKLFKQDVKKKAALERAVVQGRDADERLYQEALQLHAQQVQAWDERRRLAERILARDIASYSMALETVGCFDEVKAFGTIVTQGEARPDALLLHAEIRDQEVIPREVVKLTASGKLSTSNMAAGKYWELYQDHVCSCALRLALEVFAVLPVARMIVNISATEVSDATGHPEPRTYLAVHFTRDQVTQLNLDRIDPSSSMTNFPHRMKFAKTKGFSPVDPITFDDQFVTT